jgi:hypothetical protein
MHSSSTALLALPPALSLLTQKQVSELLNVSERTLERRPLYRLSDIENEIMERTFSSTAEAKKKPPRL